MDLKLKKISIIKPNVKIRTGIKTIARESKSNPLVPFRAFAFAKLSGEFKFGNIEILEG